MSGRVALVADMLTDYGGAEKVFLAMCEAFPGADIFTSMYLPDRTLPEFRRYDVRELVDRRVFRTTATLKQWYPIAAWQVGHKRFDDYEVVLSSSTHLARYLDKGSAKHISYCYYPFRLLFEPDRYPQVTGLRRLLMLGALPLLRRWDIRQAQRVDQFVAISQASRAAIRRYYRRDAEIVFSPILNLPESFESYAKGEFFVLVSRLERWKMVDVAVDAFRLVDLPLIVVGDGPERAALERRAGSNVEFVGTVPDSELVGYYKRARALIHAAATEYGLTPIEANAYGTPAICWGVGGVWETLVPYSQDPANATGLFYPDPTAESLAAAVRDFDRLHFDPRRCFENASRFSKKAFTGNLRALVSRALEGNTATRRGETGNDLEERS